MAAREISFSEIQDRGEGVLAEWQRSGAHTLRVTRRDDEDLVLTTATRSDQDHEAWSAVSAMVETILRVVGPGEAAKAVAAAFPWARYLSDGETFQLVDELVDALRDGAALDSREPVALTIETWRHTAEVYADLELTEALSAPTGGDGGEIPEPVVPHTADEITENADDLAWQMAANEPSEADTLDAAYLHMIRQAVVYRDDADALLTKSARVAHSHGYSWTLIASQIGISAEAARQRLDAK